MRAEIDLHRRKDVADRDAQLAGAGTVDIGIELRRIDLVAGEDAGQFLGLIGLADHGLHGFVEFGVAEAGAVLDLQLEAAGGAEAQQGRRREDDDIGFLDAGELGVESTGNGACAQLCAVAVVEGLQRQEDDGRG